MTSAKRFVRLSCSWMTSTGASPTPWSNLRGDTAVPPRREDGYVIGADQRLVQAAIEDRYPAARESGESLGRNYLEKILQVTVAIPPLSEPEVETYLALLLAQLELEGTGYERLLTAAKAQRSSGALSVAMNEGIAREALGELPDPLAEAFALTRQIAPTLASGLRGNPRQLKRFMNTFILRRTAERRGVDLKGAVAREADGARGACVSPLRAAVHMATRAGRSATAAGGRRAGALGRWHRHTDR
jgi:KAP family P-loop domain